MNEVNTTALSERIKRLEHQNKLIKLAGIVVILVMAFVLLMGAKTRAPREIVAEEFRLVDWQGRTRALLVVTQEESGLALYDENEKLRARLSVNQGGPILGLYDKKGKTKIITP